MSFYDSIPGVPVYWWELVSVQRSVNRTSTKLVFASI